ncbi:FAD-dependent oxidoreductase [Actinoallomurus vinaceus]|uniref:D-amino-acid oxidase n=1 Tax=Actinoallomurus vinaceus TaxID=1080074 RepID=A0ABP8U9R1_9ACTN
MIGSGVSGLTTAVRLAETGRKVVIWTAQPPHRTTSAAAGAIWGPYLVEPWDRVLEWSRQSLIEFRKLAEDPRTGVRMTTGIEASRRPMAEPPWASLVPNMERWGDLPNGFVDGFRYTVPVIDMPVYLSYLHQRLVTAGGTIEIRPVHTLEEAPVAEAVVNCSGLGAKELVPDHDLRPIRGEIVIIKNPGIDEFFSEDTGLSAELCCIYPHGSTAVLGGTAEDNDLGGGRNANRARSIVARCAAVIPAIADAQVIDHRVGFRPTRPSVRVQETAVSAGARLIHNYGHGGAGVTLSWGCAEAVSRIIDDPN